MLVTYLVFLLISITFRVLHWPGSAVFLLISTLFPFIDIIVQSIRKKPNKEVRIWSATSVFFISVFFLFKLLFWPGAIIIGYLMIAFFIVFTIRFFQLKLKFRFRYVVVFILFLYAGIHLMLSPSKMTMLYMVENPFKKNSKIPAYSIHRLAYIFYLEGDFEKSRTLLFNNIDHYEMIIENKEEFGIYHNHYEYNLRITYESLEMLKNREWDRFEPVLSIDFYIE